MMFYTRHYVEAKGRFNSGVIMETTEWYYCTVLGSIKMFCMKSDKSVTPSLINEGFWEAWITAWFLNNIGEGVTFLDIGANTGYYSMIADEFGAKVYAFEPQEAYARMLATSAQFRPIHVIGLALSDEEDTVALNVPKELQGSASFSHIPDQYEAKPELVHTARLDDLDYIKYGERIVVKIDTEGAEEKVWDGMANLRKQHSPVIILEYTHGCYSDQFIDKLESYGDLCWINYAGEEEPVSREWLSQQVDWVMLVLRKK